MILSWFCQIQIDALEDFGVDELFREKISGKSMANKIQLKELLDKLECGDGVAVYKLDRLGRSISDVWKTYESFHVQGIDLISISEGIDTRKNNDLMTKALITMLGLFAEMERNFINERTTEGKRLALAKGVKMGRKGKSKDLVEHAIELWQTGKYTIREIEKRTTVTKSTLYREIHKRKLSREIVSNNIIKE